MNSELEITLLNEDEMMQFGARLSQFVSSQALIYLIGDLGAGKTTFTRGFLRGLGYQGRVKSPTYTLVEPYDIKGKIVYHFDLYRIHEIEELVMMGMSDYLNEKAICIVEWPEQGKGFLPEPDLALIFDIPKSRVDKGAIAPCPPKQSNGGHTTLSPPYEGDGYINQHGRNLSVQAKTKLGCIILGQLLHA